MWRDEVEELQGRIWSMLELDPTLIDQFEYRSGWTPYPRAVHDAALRPLVDAGWVTVFEPSVSDEVPVAEAQEDVWRRIAAELSLPKDDRDLSLWLGLTPAGKAEAERLARVADPRVEVLEAA
jgi:hypothetical protein